MNKRKKTNTRDYCPYQRFEKFIVGCVIRTNGPYGIRGLKIPGVIRHVIADTKFLERPLLRRVITRVDYVRKSAAGMSVVTLYLLCFTLGRGP